MLEGVNVTNESVLEVALLRASILQRENIMMEAALNEAHKELASLRTLIPTDTEVTEDDHAYIGPDSEGDTDQPSRSA